MTDYDAAIETAEREAAGGRYKEAYNALGHALRIGGPRDSECRFRRGTFALRVAESRLDVLDDDPEAEVDLNKVASWLSRSQAYLMSASEEASGERLAEIADQLETLRAEQERFRKRWAATAGA